MNKYHLNGALPSLEDRRDWDIAAAGIASIEDVENSEYPISYLVPNLPIEMYDQGSFPTCVSFALALVKEVQDVTENPELKKPRCSTGFIYANRAEDDYQKDGMRTREALKQLQKVGVCSWNDFPYNENYPEVRNRLYSLDNCNDLIDQAYNRSIKAYYRIYSLEELKYTLLHIGPVVASVPSYSSRYWDKKTGVMTYGPVSQQTGNHAVVFVGWKDNDTIIVRNSWGADWGDGGYGYLNFNEYDINEMWAITDRLTPEIEQYYECKAGNHKFIEKTNAMKISSCQEIVENSTVCSGCGIVKPGTEVTKMSVYSHDFGEYEQQRAPSCINPGFEIRTCKKCGATDVHTTGYAEHEWGEWQEIRTATTTRPARFRRACNLCIAYEYKDGEVKTTIFTKILNFVKGLLSILFK